MHYFETTTKKLAHLLELARTNPEATPEDLAELKKAETLIDQNHSDNTPMNIVNLEQTAAYSIWWGKPDIQAIIESGEFEDYISNCSNEEIEKLIDISLNEIDWNHVQSCNFNYENPIADGIEIALRKMGLMSNSNTDNIYDIYTDDIYDIY